MNRMFIASMVTAAVFAFSSSSAIAQSNIVLAVLADVAKVTADKANAPKALPTGTTRVAVFNIGVVFAKYERTVAMKAETAQELKHFQEEAKELAQNLKAWQSALQGNDLSPAKKAQYEEKSINARRRLEDLDRQARAKLGKTQEAGVVMLWKDIREVVKSYSAKHGIDLVIVYGDVNDKSQSEAFPNITRKMQALDQGGSMPFLMNPGVDISEAIVELLNRQYRAKNADQEDPQ